MAGGQIAGGAAWTAIGNRAGVLPAATASHFRGESFLKSCEINHNFAQFPPVVGEVFLEKGIQRYSHSKALDTTDSRTVWRDSPKNRKQKKRSRTLARQLLAIFRKGL